LGVGPSEAPTLHAQVFELKEIACRMKSAYETSVDVQVVFVRGLCEKIEVADEAPGITDQGFLLDYYVTRIVTYLLIP
jgi:hypothetical protein